MPRFEPSLTKYCACNREGRIGILRFRLGGRTAFPLRHHEMRAPSKHSGHETASLQPGVIFSSWPKHLLAENPAREGDIWISSNLNCACHQKVTKAPCQVLHLPRKMTLAFHHELHRPRIQLVHMLQVTLELDLRQKVIWKLHQVLHLAKKWHLNVAKHCTCHQNWKWH